MTTENQGSNWLGLILRAAVVIPVVILKSLWDRLWRRRERTTR